MRRIPYINNVGEIEAGSLFPSLRLLYRQGLIIPIHTGINWTEAVTGTGTSSQDVSRLLVTTGATAGSSAMRRMQLAQVNVGAGIVELDLNWDKRLSLIFVISRGTSAASSEGYFQLKSVNTIGDLGDKGFGLKLNNFALWGESYGVALGGVNLAVSLTTRQPAVIQIDHDPASAIRWYINGALKGTQSTADNIPSGESTAFYLVFSLENNTDAVDINSSLSQITILAEI